MLKRVITGAGFTVLVLAAIVLRGAAMRALIGLAMFICTHEMHRAIQRSGRPTILWTGYLFCALTLLAGEISADASISVMPLVASVLAVMIHLVIQGKVAFETMMASVFPMLYPGIFYMVLLALTRLENEAFVVVALVLAFFSASINDVFALFSGLLFGKHKLSPELSPKKTWEGSVGGLVFCVLFSMAVPYIIELVFGADPAFSAGFDALPPTWAFGILGLVAGALSQIGDLAASMVKRHCGVKDFGKLLPGHGGVMDRMDGVLFCCVACYAFFVLIELGWFI